jgi:hypothetical protein
MRKFGPLQRSQACEAAPITGVEIIKQTTAGNHIPNRCVYFADAERQEAVEMFASYLTVHTRAARTGVESSDGACPWSLHMGHPSLVVSVWLECLHVRGVRKCVHACVRVCVCACACACVSLFAIANKLRLILR